MKENKFSINIVEWQDGKLKVTDVKCDNIEDAKELIKSMRGENIKIKIYDSFNNNVIHVETEDCEDTYA